YTQPLAAVKPCSVKVADRAASQTALPCNVKVSAVTRKPLPATGGGLAVAGLVNVSIGPAETSPTDTSPTHQRLSSRANRRRGHMTSLLSRMGETVWRAGMPRLTGAAAHAGHARLS